MITRTELEQALISDPEAYNRKLDEYTKQCPDTARKWKDYGMLRFLMRNQEHIDFVVGSVIPSLPGVAPINVVRMRRALMETLVATERFKGVFFENAIEGGAYLRRIGVASPKDVPGDLADRVALAASKVAEMDDEDVFYLLTHGAHWIVTGAKTQEEIRAIVERFDHEVTWVPHVRKRERDDDGENPEPRAKKTKPLS